MRPWQQALKDMRHSRDPQVKEDAFDLLRARPAELVAQLRAAYEAETDHGTKCWLLELLDEARRSGTGRSLHLCAQRAR